MLGRLLNLNDPDRALVGRARRGDVGAFDVLVRQHAPALISYLRARLQSLEEAEDVAQETLVAAWRQMGAFRGQGRFKTWLFGIAAHKCVDALRGRERWQRQTLDDRFIQGNGVLTAENEPLTAFQRADDALRIRRAVAELPEKQRRVLELYYYCQLTLPQVASILNLNPSTVKYQFYQGHRNLRALLTYGLDADPRPSALARARKTTP